MKWIKSDVVLDGFLYACIASFTFSQAFFNSDEAYKYVNPFILFWMKYVFGMGAATAGAVKMFRSTVFADNKNGVDNPPKLPQPEPPKQ